MYLTQSNTKSKQNHPIPVTSSLEGSIFQRRPIDLLLAQGDERDKTTKTVVEQRYESTVDTNCLCCIKCVNSDYKSYDVGIAPTFNEFNQHIKIILNLKP